MNKEFAYNYGDYYVNDRFVRMRFEIVKNLLDAYLFDGARIVDIGCYDGALYKMLKTLKKKCGYVGVDADEHALAILSQQGVETIALNFESEKLPFSDDSFDVVVLGEILEHLRNPRQLIEQAKRILKPSGYLLVSLPNECTLYHRFKMLLGKGIDGTGFEPGYHLHFPTLRQNRDFISQYFKILETRYWYHLGVGGILERVFSKFPHKLLQSATNSFPSLFARGGIYLCQK